MGTARVVSSRAMHITSRRDSPVDAERGVSDSLSSRIQRTARFLPAGAPVTIDPDGRRVLRFLFPISECTLICLRLGSSARERAHRLPAGRGDESGIVRRPRRGLYSPSLDISRETTPSSAPDDTTVRPRWKLPVPREAGGHSHLFASRTRPDKNVRLCLPARPL